MESEPDMERTPKRSNRGIKFKKQSTPRLEEPEEENGPSQAKRDEIIKRLGIRDRKSASEAMGGRQKSSDRNLRRRFSMGTIGLPKSQGEDSATQQYSTNSDALTTSDDEE